MIHPKHKLASRRTDDLEQLRTFSLVVAPTNDNNTLPRARKFTPVLYAADQAAHLYSFNLKQPFSFLLPGTSTFWKDDVVLPTVPYNASIHTAKLVKVIRYFHGLEVLPHPLCLPDLAL